MYHVGFFFEFVSLFMYLFFGEERASQAIFGSVLDDKLIFFVPAKVWQLDCGICECIAH